MVAEPLLEDVNCCNRCHASAYCVGFDEERLYFECAATTARHRWFELRDDPWCELCNELLSEHNLLVSKADVEDEYVVCPSSLEDNTFVRKE